MRSIDENKKTAIVKAAINLVTTRGFEGTSMSRLAKMAGVSPATIYIYYENKEDMLIKIFLDLKKSYSEALQKDLYENIPIREGLRLVFENLLAFFLEYPGEFMFLELFNDSPLYEKISEKMVLSWYSPLITLIQRGQENKVIRDAPLFMIYSYFIIPATDFVKLKAREKAELTQDEKEIMFNMSWNAITI